MEESIPEVASLSRWDYVSCRSSFHTGTHSHQVIVKTTPDVTGSGSLLGQKKIRREETDEVDTGVGRLDIHRLLEVQAIKCAVQGRVGRRQKERESENEERSGDVKTPSGRGDGAQGITKKTRSGRGQASSQGSPEGESGSKTSAKEGIGCS